MFQFFVIAAFLGTNFCSLIYVWQITINFSGLRCNDHLLCAWICGQEFGKGLAGLFLFYVWCFLRSRYSSDGWYYLKIQNDSWKARLSWVSLAFPVVQGLLCVTYPEESLNFLHDMPLRFKTGTCLFSHYSDNQRNY